MSSARIAGGTEGGRTVGRVDLSTAEIVDAHTHPYRLEDLLGRDDAGFDTRMTFLGESFASSSRIGEDLWPFVDELTGTTVLASAVRRWLAEHLGCDPTREAVTEGRASALRGDPVGYTRGLLEAAGVVAVLSDEGFPQPPVPADEFARTIGVTVHRVVRLEPWILQHRERTFDDLVSGVSTRRRGGVGPQLRRVQVDRGVPHGPGRRQPPRVRTQRRVRAVARDGWTESRDQAKPVRDFDPPHPPDGEGARPGVPFPLRRRRPGHRPGARAARAAVPAARRPPGPARRARPQRLPVDPGGGLHRVGPAEGVPRAVRADPLGFGQVEWALEMLVGTVPAAKLLYGSDEAGEPEAFWVSALLAPDARACARAVRGPGLRGRGRGRAPGPAGPCGRPPPPARVGGLDR